MRARDRILWLLNFAGGKSLSSGEIGAVADVGSWRLYPILAELERNGLVESEFASEPYPRRRRYLLTYKGEAALPEAAPRFAAREGAQNV